MIDPSGSEPSPDPHAGDGSVEHALGQLYRDHVDDARRLAYILVGSDQADELVAEAFARVLGQVRAGRGPTSDFRSYLHVTIRNIFRDSLRRNRETPMSDQPWIFEDTAASPEEALDDFDEQAAAAAFATLPTAWQRVLWYVEIEGRKPAEVARILDLRPRAVSSLAHRAREGLRRAYLEAHLGTATVAEQCAWSHARLSQYVRGDLSDGAAGKVASHLETCPDCMAAYLQLETVNRKLAAYLFPVVLLGALPAGGQPVAWLVGQFGALTSGFASAAGTTGTGAAATGTAATGTAATIPGGLMTGLLVGAAALAVVGGIAVVVANNDASDRDGARPVQEQAATPDPGPSGDRPVHPAAPHARSHPGPPVAVPPSIDPVSLVASTDSASPSTPDEAAGPTGPGPTNPGPTNPGPTGPGPSDPSPITVTPVAPTATPAGCEVGSLVLPTTPGIDYALTVGDGRTGPWQVTATARTGYVLAGGTRVFTGDLGQLDACARLASVTSTSALGPLGLLWRTQVTPEVTGGPNRTISAVLDFRDEILLQAGAVSGEGWSCHAPDRTPVGALIEFVFPIGSPGLPITCEVDYTGTPVAPLVVDTISLDLLARTPLSAVTLLSGAEEVGSVPFP